MYLSLWLGNRGPPLAAKLDVRDQAGADGFRGSGLHTKVPGTAAEASFLFSFCVGFGEPGTFCGSQQQGCFPILQEDDWQKGKKAG